MGKVRGSPRPKVRGSSALPGLVALGSRKGGLSKGAFCAKQTFLQGNGLPSAVLQGNGFQKNPRAHKNKIGTPPPQKKNPKKGNFTDMVFPAERTHFSRCP